MRDQRLVDVELEVSARTADADGDVIAHHPCTHHRHGLALGRIDLARHDRATWLVLGNRQLAEATARTACEPADVVRDLRQAACELLERAMKTDERVVGCERLELVRRGHKRSPRELRE